MKNSKKDRNIEILINKGRNIIKRVKQHFYEFGFAYRFILSKIYAIAMLAMGIHLEVAHFQKKLPFGLVYSVSGGLEIWTIWSYTGRFIGIFVMMYGIWKLAPRLIEELLDRCVQMTHRM